MKIFADTLIAPDEIWVDWHSDFNNPGDMHLKRYYINLFEVIENGNKVYGLSVFSYSKNSWDATTVFPPKHNKDFSVMENYIKNQRKGMSLY